MQEFISAFMILGSIIIWMLLNRRVSISDIACKQLEDLDAKLRDLQSKISNRS